MKKAWKYTLAAVGVPLLCFGGLALDSTYRAISAIATHDARLVADIAAARVGHPPRTKNDYSFEDGHTGRSSAQSIDAVIRDSLRAPTPDAILKHLETAHEQLWEGGYAAAYERAHFDKFALRRLQGLLNAEPLAAGELRDLSQSLDRLHSTRPTAVDIVTGEHLLDRAEVLNVLHLKRDPYGMIRRPPGWREFFSWRILIAKTLLQLDDHYREILPLASLPVSEGERAASEWKGWTEKEGVLGRTHLRLHAETKFRVQRFLAAEWQFTRLAISMSLFQAEKGRSPQDLKELVPDYLPSLPASPLDGAPYMFEKGALRDVGLRATWLLAPK